MTDYEYLTERVGMSGKVEVSGIVKTFNKRTVTIPGWGIEMEKQHKDGTIELHDYSKIKINNKTFEVKENVCLSFWDTFPEGIKELQEISFKGLLSHLSTNHEIGLGNIHTAGIVIIE